MTLKIMKSTSQAGPRCDPKKRDLRPWFLGLFTMRIHQKVTMPKKHITPMKSCRKPSTAQLPKTNQFHSGLRDSSTAYASR